MNKPQVKPDPMMLPPPALPVLLPGSSITEPMDLCSPPFSAPSSPLFVPLLAPPPPRTPESQIARFDENGVPLGEPTPKSLGLITPDQPVDNSFLYVFDYPTTGSVAPWNQIPDALSPTSYQLPHPPYMAGGIEQSASPTPHPRDLPSDHSINIMGRQAQKEAYELNANVNHPQGLVVVRSARTYAWQRWNSGLSTGIGRLPYHPITRLHQHGLSYCIHAVPTYELRLGPMFVTDHGVGLHVFDDIHMIAYSFLARPQPQNFEPKSFFTQVVPTRTLSRCDGCGGFHLSEYTQLWLVIKEDDVILPPGTAEVPPGYIIQGICLHCGGNNPRRLLPNGFARCCMDADQLGLWNVLGLTDGTELPVRPLASRNRYSSAP